MNCTPPRRKLLADPERERVSEEVNGGFREAPWGQ
jgi:hypothetical protein